jgi:hypothetical protein
MLFEWDQLVGTKHNCPTEKVLYTFDNENKTNCLARWPHVLDIQTASLDEDTPVGVIDLLTCIQAILSARLDFLPLW